MTGAVRGARPLRVSAINQTDISARGRMHLIHAIQQAACSDSGGVRYVIIPLNSIHITRLRGYHIGYTAAYRQSSSVRPSMY